MSFWVRDFLSIVAWKFRQVHSEGGFAWTTGRILGLGPWLSSQIGVAICLHLLFSPRITRPPARSDVNEARNPLLADVATGNNWLVTGPRTNEFRSIFLFHQKHSPQAHLMIRNFRHFWGPPCILITRDDGALSPPTDRRGWPSAYISGPPPPHPSLRVESFP